MMGAEIKARKMGIKGKRWNKEMKNAKVRDRAYGKKKNNNKKNKQNSVWSEEKLIDKK